MTLYVPGMRLSHQAFPTTARSATKTTTPAIDAMRPASCLDIARMVARSLGGGQP